MWDFFACLFEIREIVGSISATLSCLRGLLSRTAAGNRAYGNRHDPNKRPSTQPKPLVSPFKPNHRVCLVNSYLSTVRSRVFCFNQMPKKVIWRNPCSIDSVAQSLQRFTFIVLRRFFQQLTKR